MTVSVTPAPARKARSTTAGAGGGGLDEAWLLVQAPPRKQSHATRAAACCFAIGVRPRVVRFYSLLLLALVLLLVLAASVTTDDGGAEPPTTVPRSSQGTGIGGVRGVHQQGAGGCDMSSGRWVYDGAAYPVYRESACRFMSDQAACEKFGRTDRRYQRWRWQPHGCDLPRYVSVSVAVSCPKVGIRPFLWGYGQRGTMYGWDRCSENLREKRCFQIVLSNQS
jgi:hypothetical protein